MQRLALFTRFAAWLKGHSGRFLFANEAIVANDILSPCIPTAFSAVNEEAKTRRVLLAPYGEWPNRRGLQKFDKQDALNIVSDFENPLTNVILPNENGRRTPSGVDPSRLMGLPWFIGHPDHDDFKKDYPDKKAYGRIKKLEVADDGIYANVKFGSEGERLISDEAFSSHSVNWYLTEDPRQKGKFRPVKLKSVGFTNFPNIPVPGVTTANEWVGGEVLVREHFRKLARMRLLAANECGPDDKAKLRLKRMANMRRKKLSSGK